jgi:hypothetical protein
MCEHASDSPGVFGDRQGIGRIGDAADSTPRAGAGL